MIDLYYHRRNTCLTLHIITPFFILFIWIVQDICNSCSAGPTETQQEHQEMRGQGHPWQKGKVWVMWAQPLSSLFDASRNERGFPLIMKPANISC